MEEVRNIPVYIVNSSFTALTSSGEATIVQENLRVGFLLNFKTNDKNCLLDEMDLQLSIVYGPHDRFSIGNVKFKRNGEYFNGLLNLELSPDLAFVLSGARSITNHV